MPNEWGSAAFRVFSLRRVFPTPKHCIAPRPAATLNRQLATVVIYVTKKLASCRAASKITYSVHLQVLRCRLFLFVLALLAFPTEGLAMSNRLLRSL